MQKNGIQNFGWRKINKYLLRDDKTVAGKISFMSEFQLKSLNYFILLKMKYNNIGFFDQNAQSFCLFKMGTIAFCGKISGGFSIQIFIEYSIVI